jgi:subtilase family serine protease
MSLYNVSRYVGHRVWTAVLGLLLVLLASCGGPNPVNIPTPTPPEIQFTTIDLKLPPEALNAPVVGPLPDETILHVGVTFKINQQLLDQLNKKKVQTGENQDLQGLANKLGISDKDYQKIKAFFGVENATLQLNKLHTNLTIDAKAKTFARLLQTHFVIHQLNGRKFYIPAADAPPKLPTFIANQILAITGLDNYSVPPQRAGRMLHSNNVNMNVRKSPAGNCNMPHILTPSLVSHLYGYDQFYKSGYHGEGMTVNLIEIDGLSQSDLQNYLGCVHYQGRLTTVTVGNSTPPPGVEATVDVEMIAGLAPAANIVDYQADTSNIQSFNDFWTLLNDELQQLINDNTRNGGGGSVVSISLGAPEAALTQANVAAIDQSLTILTKAEHMTVFIASGDCGAFGFGGFVKDAYGKLAVSYPASDPWTVAVGGTTPVVDQNTNTISEVVWSDGSNHNVCKHQWGSGGGLSQVFKRPSWQSGQVVQNKFANGARQMPDISAFADFLACYIQGHWGDCGGTSFATPIWASGMVLVNQALIRQARLFFFGPSLFYAVAQIGASNKLHPYFDVTRGNNLFYPATPEWDFATGFGSPNLPVFFNILLAAAKQ